MNIGRTQWLVGREGNGTQTHTHKHTHRVPRDTQGGWSVEQGSDAILTNACVDCTLIMLMGYEHREDSVGVGGAGNGKNTHTHSVPRDTQGRWSLGQELEQS